MTAHSVDGAALPRHQTARLVSSDALTPVPLAIAVWRAVVSQWHGAPATTRWAWSLVAIFGLLDLVLVPAAGFTVATGWILLAIVSPLPLAVIAGFYAHNERDTGLSTMAWAFALLLACMVAVGPFCYVGMSWALPAVDATLSRIDQALGFDWIAYNNLVTGSHVAQEVMVRLYFSSAPQVFVFVMLLVWLKRIDRVHELVFLLVVSAFATATLSALFPALGAHAFYGVPDGGKAFYLDHLTALRAGTLRHLDPTNMVGLCTWPSYHTIISLTLIRVTWGVRFVGPITLMWNVALLAAVPVWGSHFLADMIGGALVLAGAMAGWRVLRRPRLVPTAGPVAT